MPKELPDVAKKIFYDTMDNLKLRLNYDRNVVFAMGFLAYWREKGFDTEEYENGLKVYINDKIRHREKD